MADHEGDEVDCKVHDNRHGQVGGARVGRAEADARERGRDHIDRRRSVRVEDAEEDGLRRDREGDAGAGGHARSY